jgi:hypothetical protein
VPYDLRGSFVSLLATRDSDPDRWRDRAVPEQLIQMAAIALRLSERSGLRELGRWVQMLGFRGTLSRSPAATPPTSANDAPSAPPTAPTETNRRTTPTTTTTTTIVLSVWQYLGSGYLNPGDALLAAGVEASLRAAREALLDLRRGPP